jgi:hypothetical protein
VVRFANDDELPPGQDWMLLEVEGKTYCVVRSSKVCPEVLEEAWAGYRRLVDAERHGLNSGERDRLASVLHRLERQLVD